MTSIVRILIALLASQNGIDVETLVTRYITSAEQYQKTLQNLTAPERKHWSSFVPPESSTNDARLFQISSSTTRLAMARTS
jgi:hypothetical protein